MNLSPYTLLATPPFYRPLLPARKMVRAGPVAKPPELFLYLRGQSSESMTCADQCPGWLRADLGIIIAQKAWLELVLHTRGAINNGLTEVEIREVVLQATVYCGTPAGVEAMQVTERTINEMIANGEYKRPEA